VDARIVHTTTPLDVAYRLGREVLGPPFLAFARLLLSASREDGASKLVFVARDGDFLMRVTEAVCNGPSDPPVSPQLSYLHLSRRSTALPGEVRFNRSSILRATEIRAGMPTIGSLLAYYGLSQARYETLLQRHGLTAGTPLDLSSIDSLLANAKFMDWLDADRAVQRDLLQAYLEQQGVLGQPGIALVDIGWRGAICTALSSAFADRFQAIPLNAYFLGYWHESGCLAAPGIRIRGLLADFRHSRSPREGAARYLAFPLEALCRANHGTVTGYRRNFDGKVEPVLADPHDVPPDPIREEIRRGILDHVQTHVQSAASVESPAQAIDCRRDAQQRLFRLAFFPGAGEIATLRNLLHSEGHANGWQRPQIDPHPSSPWRQPRRWLTGLASPWRAGYVMANGGPLLSTLFVILESLLLMLPVHWRTSLQSWARRRAGLR
jgi:hypothetical protein